MYVLHEYISCYRHERNKWYALHHGLNEVKINGEVIPKYPEKILLRDNDKLAIGPNDEFLFEVGSQKTIFFFVVVVVSFAS